MFTQLGLILDGIAAATTLPTVLAIWVIFAIIVLVFKLLGFVLKVGLKILAVFVIASLVMGAFGLSAAGVVAVIGAIAACLAPSHV